MEELIPFTMLNDFVFCPASIYFHHMYDGVENLLFTGKKQLKGKKLHKNIDDNSWSQSDAICSRSYVSQKYGLYGKIDKYYPKTEELVESKAKIIKVYDGYIFQLYAQYFAMTECGIAVKKLSLYSIENNKKIAVDLPVDDEEMLKNFENLIEEIRAFSIDDFKAKNIEKCKQCIYSNACSWGV